MRNSVCKYLQKSNALTCANKRRVRYRQYVVATPMPNSRKYILCQSIKYAYATGEMCRLALQQERNKSTHSKYYWSLINRVENSSICRYYKYLATDKKIMYRNNSKIENSIYFQRKRCTTRTSLFSLWIAHDPESGFDQFHLIVNRGSGTIFQWHRIDDHLLIRANFHIVLVQFVVQFEFVLESRAAAAVHSDAQEVFFICANLFEFAHASVAQHECLTDILCWIGCCSHGWVYWLCGGVTSTDGGRCECSESVIRGLVVKYG